MMLKIGSFIGCFLFVLTAVGQVTLLLNKVPEILDENQSIYISGDFEGWTGGQEKFKLIKKNDDYIITLPNQHQTINYKFTRGSWDTVEANLDGSPIENRTYDFGKRNDTIRIDVLGWSSKETKVSTAENNVSVLYNKLIIPQLNRARRIWIYLPPDYENTTESYPVLYMHDGQNVFDALTSYAGEWGVDEALNKLYNEKGFKLIVVAIDNDGEKRLNEYSPWENLKYGNPEGSAYAEFIVNTLKPQIDKTYRTLSNRKNSAIMGSSMGGLISFYVGLKYSQVFSKVGVFSPSFWYSKRSFEFATEQHGINDLKMYFLVGTKEGANMVSNVNKMTRIMKSNGFNENNISKKIVEDAGHNEQFWRSEFEEAILWLFRK